jgi:hypothetical protein
MGWVLAITGVGAGLISLAGWVSVLADREQQRRVIAEREREKELILHFDAAKKTAKVGPFDPASSGVPNIPPVNEEGVNLAAAGHTSR